MASADGTLSVREWREAYASGKFGSNVDGMCAAGWYDWFCSDSALPGRLEEFISLIKGITNDFILDNFYVWFKNNCPIVGPLYDDIRFEPLDEARLRGLEYLFVISRGDAREKHLWCVYDPSNDFTCPVFGADRVGDVVKWINNKRF